MLALEEPARLELAAAAREQAAKFSTAQFDMGCCDACSHIIEHLNAEAARARRLGAGRRA